MNIHEGKGCRNVVYKSICCGEHLTFFILDTGKHILWQTVKTQMKCHIRQHFIRVCIVC